MKLYYLGTSYGAPSPNRCQQSLLLEVSDGGLYLFDAGAPVLDRMVRLGLAPNRLRAIFISHLHGDHMNGLHDIFNLCAYFDIRCPVYLTEQRGMDAFTTFNEMQCGGHPADRMPLRLYSGGVVYADDVLRVTACPSAHMESQNRPSYGFLTEAEGKRIYITGDLHPSMKDLPNLLFETETDLIITECAHFEADALYTRLAPAKTAALAVIHVMPPQRYEALQRLADRVPFPVVFPEDTEVWEPAPVDQDTCR